MQVKFFKNVRFKGDWELNFIGLKYNLRIGRSQVAFWKFSKPVLMWLAKVNN